MPRIAVLDDYQNVARGLADWARLPAGWTLDVFNRQIVGEAAGRKRWRRTRSSSSCASGRRFRPA